MKNAPKGPATPPTRPLELPLVGIGVALLAAVAGLTMLGLGPAAGSVTGVMLTFLLAFLGLGLFVTALIIRACRVRDAAKEDDAWW